MADTAWTANTILVTAGTVAVRKATETIVEGDWVYEVAAGSTVGVATNADATKDQVIGQAIRGGVTGTHIAIALNGCTCTATATPAITTLYLPPLAVPLPAPCRTNSSTIAAAMTVTAWPVMPLPTA